ncbi:MAG TPA: RseA family anti-sigma factor [Telluria sp.]
MDTHKKMRELVSALVDGEVSDADLELAFAALLEQDGQRAWALYHQVGDAVRAADGAALSDGFAARLAARLDAESATAAAAVEPEPPALSRPAP